MKRPLVAAALLSSAVAAAGCFIITGSTSGYTEAPATTSEGGCEAATDCTGDGGVEICCLGATTMSASCQAGPCGTAAIQLCAKTAECDDASCTEQSCTFGGATYMLRACGLIPSCTP